MQGKLGRISLFGVIADDLIVSVSFQNDLYIFPHSIFHRRSYIRLHPWSLSVFWNKHKLNPMSAELTVGENQGKDDKVGQTQCFLGKMSAQSYLISITCHLFCSVVSITDCSSRVCITVQGSFLPLLVVCSYCNTFWIWYHCLSFLSYAAYNCNPSLFQLISLIHHGADSSKSKNGYLLYIQI